MNLHRSNLTSVAYKITPYCHTERRHKVPQSNVSGSTKTEQVYHWNAWFLPNKIFRLHSFHSFRSRWRSSEYCFLSVILSEVRNVSDERSRTYLDGLIPSLCSINLHGFSIARSFDSAYGSAQDDSVGSPTSAQDDGVVSTASSVSYWAKWGM